MEKVFNLPSRETIAKCNELEKMAGRFSDLANDLLKIGHVRLAQLAISAQNDLLDESGYLWHQSAHRGAK